MGEAWRRVGDDEACDVSTVPLVLLRAASTIGRDSDPLGHRDDEIRAVLVRYNGTGDEAVAYGERVLGMCTVVEECDAPVCDL